MKKGCLHFAWNIHIEKSHCRSAIKLNRRTDPWVFLETESFLGGFASVFVERNREVLSSKPEETTLPKRFSDVIDQQTEDVIAELSEVFIRCVINK